MIVNYVIVLAIPVLVPKVMNVFHVMLIDILKEINVYFAMILVILVMDH
jgi:hypothetical protein